jgi:transcription elongation factor Elf1
MDTKMDIKLNIKKNFICKNCNKNYSSYKSLWNHNKKFHINLTINDNQMLPICQSIISTWQPIVYPSKPIIHLNQLTKNIKCGICNKEFNTRQAKSKHKKNVK